MRSRWFQPTLVLLLLVLSVNGCDRSPEQKEARALKEGDTYFAKGENEKARLDYRKAIQIKPTDAVPYYRLGMVDDSEGHFHEAYENFAKAEFQDGDYHPVMLKLAEYYIVAGNYDAALKRLYAVLVDDPDDAQAHALLATRLLKLKQYADAEEEAHKALSADPANVQASLVLADAFYADNKPAQAIAAVVAGLVHNPKNTKLLHLQVALYEQINDTVGASRAYQQLFAADPADKSARLHLAEYDAKAGQMDQAEAVWRDGVKALPDDWEMKHGLVLFLAAHRGIDKAEKEAQDYIKAYPKQPEPIDWLTKLCVTHNQNDQAAVFLDEIIKHDRGDKAWMMAMTSRAKIDYIKSNLDLASQRVAQVLAKNPANIEARYLKIRIESDQGNYEQAVTDLRDMVRDAPKSAEIYDLLSQNLLRQGHTDLAIEALNQSVDINPDNIQTRIRLAQLYQIHGDPHHAMEILFLVTKTAPDSAAAWEAIAHLALESKEWSTADMALAALAKIPGTNATVLLFKGNKLALTGDWTGASAAYMNVVALNPESPQAELALTAIAEHAQAQKQLPQTVRYLAGIKPSTPFINTLLGRCYLSMNNFDAATTAFDAAIANHATQQDPYLERANLFMRQHQPDAAMKILTAGAAVDQTDMRIPLAEAQLLEERGDYVGSIKAYEAVLAQQSSDAFAANNLAEVIADHAYNDPKLMEQARQIVDHITSQNPLLLDTKAWVYFRQGRVQEALHLLQRAHDLADKEPLPPQFHYHYGVVLDAVHSDNDAQAELSLAVVKGSDYPGKAEAEKLLSTLSIVH